MISESVDILVVTTAADAASDSVVAALQNVGAHFGRINTEDFPVRARSIASFGSGQSFVWSSDSAINLSAVRSVWFRRHRLPIITNMLPAHAEYALRESEAYLKGILFALHRQGGGIRWMSEPTALWEAESKMRQLQAASALGLACPPTLISNDPTAIRAFEQAYRPIVAKPLKLGYFDYGETQAATFTTAITEQALSDDSALTAAPVIYQAQIPKRFDVRVTIVGREIFAALIDSQSEPSAQIDWRKTDNDLAHHRHQLPETVADRCLQLMEELRLKFGALDFILTPTGEYIFLEVNPNGQWLWIEDKLKFPITAAITRWLCEK